MFTNVYLHTTNPNTPLREIINRNTLLSILVHTLLYISFFNLANYTFTGRLLSFEINTRILILLLIIMTLGYIGRYYHVQEIYKAYQKDMQKTREHCDKMFITWFFSG